MQLLLTLAGAIALGAVVGMAARVLLPGKQSLPVAISVGLGVLGAGIGASVATALGLGGDPTEFNATAIAVGIVAAAILTVAYGLITGRRQL